MTTDRVPLRSLPLNSLAAVSSAATSVISAIKEKTIVGISSHLVAEHGVELDGLDAQLAGVERMLRSIESYLVQERISLERADKFVHDCKQQQLLLEHMRLHLPPHLPRAPSLHAHTARPSEPAGTQWPAVTPVAFKMPPSLLIPPSPSSLAPSFSESPATARARQQQLAATVMKQSQSQSASIAALTDAGAGEPRAPRRRAPRNFVGKDELQACSSYLLGRLTQDKINNALDEVATLAERNAKVMACLRGAGPAVSLQPAERERALDLVHNMAKHPDVKGHFWFTEYDLRDGVSIKRDKTGKSILQILRHCKRLHEVRGRIQGQSEVVYVLTPHA